MFSWFERMIDPFASKDLSQPPNSVLAFCWYFVRPYWKIFAAVALMSAMVAIFEVMIFSFLGDLVNWLSSESKETFFDNNLGHLIWIGVVIVIILPVLHFLWELLFHQSLMGNYPMAIRWRLHRYLLRQSYEFYQNDFAGRVATKLMQTALAVREVATKASELLVYIVVYFASAVVVVAEADWRLALPLLVWLVLYIAAMYVFVPKLQKISQKQAHARSTMTGHIVDAYTNIPTVKLFSHAAREETYARGSMFGFLKTVYGQMRLVTVLNMTLMTINTALLFSVGVLSIWLWQVSKVTTGDIALVIGLVIRLQGMSQWIMWELGTLFESIGTVADGISTISQPRKVLDVPGAKSLSVKRGTVEFDNIKFHYGKSGGVIDNLNLTIEPGEKIGLVGRSGAGKSTLVNLLLRFYDLEGGHIRIDGQDIAQVRQDSLRENISVVTQDTSLLHRSVMENIAYGKPDASMEEIITASERAQALEFIKGLEDQNGQTGFDAHVGERGVKLSGGQRQRIAIARVLLKNAPILILDEATSALDSEVESAIQEQLNNLMAGKTVIAIAHRLSTIAAMDRLVIMENGRIVEQGSHNALLQQKGVYAGLWARQSGGFIEPPSEDKDTEPAE
ncbi:MAG: ABC transporter ATP-binding protein [Stappiaceae bacterium]